MRLTPRLQPSQGAPPARLSISQRRLSEDTLIDQALQPGSLRVTVQRPTEQATDQRLAAQDCSPVFARGENIPLCRHGYPPMSEMTGSTLTHRRPCRRPPDRSDPL